VGAGRLEEALGVFWTGAAVGSGVLAGLGLAATQPEMSMRIRKPANSLLGIRGLGIGKL
jgi:hypothetical protein